MKRTLLAVGIAVIVSTMLILIPFAVAQTMSSSPAPRVKFKEFALYAPPPKYPTDALRTRAEGSGIVLMEIDEKRAGLNRPRWKKALVINFWMTLLFKHSVNGDLGPALFGDSVLL